MGRFQNGMNKTISRVALAAGVVVTMAGSAAAQRPDTLTLTGPGSTIGVSIRDLSADDSSRAKVAEGSGVLVDDVRDGTPAARAGFRKGDVIVEFDGERVRSARQMTRLVRETPPRRQVTAVVQRDGARQTLKVAPEERTSVDVQRFPEIAGRVENLEPLESVIGRLGDSDFNFAFPRVNVRPRRLGVELAPIGDQLAAYFGVKQGVLVSSVEADSPAARAGLKAGDVITGVNGRDVATTSDLTGAVNRADPEGMLELRIMRDRKEQTLKATMPAAPERAPFRIRGARI
jgi:serine protease Do